MINISKAAKGEILRLRSKRQNQDLCLRLAVKQGGCSGFSYSIEFERMEGSEDNVYDCGGIIVLVAAEDLKFINGLTIDYSEDLMGGGFRFHNPNAVQSCGCGNSFAVEV
ncbi:iron-sulfur cluster assembly accessory protein [Microcoleus sp. FACHB-831]|jgi:iron-sulfur cluster assembly accessory protein|uniref:HesB/IscA family protein n=1 Tax=Microcoleus sp. FACHB-831 TaxID=2692827 RepID=UPI001689AFDE|nr:iron-sulfur cluster assembly accessory protein [Microcoleus sp. FACHB-831]MBD1922785.1 iron-sulfur cluster assembly accessory protein [Microcoleus sp. FACHB-831]